ncbi:serine/threonine-protein kinase [Nocardiopsis composta]|uniref:serine/threonine-protein kinase n=1 Tax=Nocardiopsis composta TaxID=157465 RepID=UPI0031D4A9EE
MHTAAPLLDGDPAELGGYRLLGRLGSGGQGTVYLGTDAEGTLAAIKVLNSEGIDDPDVRRRFQSEAETAGRVASFCTAAVLAADFTADPPYIASEYVEGESLHAHVARGGPLSGGDLQRLAVNTATALAAIHEAGIVHRDFKPGNVLLAQGGPRVIDFGIAQAAHGAGTRTQSVIGTPAFMAPEQIAHGDATAASDIFAWGAVIAFAATGASPFDGPTVPNVLHNVINAEPELSALPDPLRALVGSALAKDPAARPTSVDLLMALLGRRERPRNDSEVTAVLRDAPATVPTPPPAAPAPPARSSGEGRRRTAPRWLLVAGALLAVAALVGAGVYIGRSSAGNGTDPGGQGGGADAQGGEGIDDPAAGATAAQVPRFGPDAAGAWEGVSDGGDLLPIEVEEGEQSAVIEFPEDSACGSTLKLTREADGVFEAAIEVESSAKYFSDCVGAGGRWDPESAVLSVDGDTLALRLIPPEDDGKQTTLLLARAAG